MDQTTTVVTPKKPTNKKNLVVVIISLVVLVIGLIAGLILIRSQQNVSEKASTSTGVAKVKISPETKTIKVGDSFNADIYFDTGGRSISAITILLTYTYSGSEPPITTEELVKIDSNLVLDGNWNFPIKSVATQNGTVQIKIGGFNKSQSGYTSSGEEPLASITFKGKSAGTITVSFDTSQSKITNKDDGADVLLTPTVTGRYTVEGSTTTTPTASSSASPSSTATMSATARPIPVTGIELPTALGIGLGTLLIVGSAFLVF